MNSKVFPLELIVLLVGGANAAQQIFDILVKSLIKLLRSLTLSIFIDILQNGEASVQRLNENATLGRGQVVLVQAILADGVVLLDLLDELGDGNDFIEAVRGNLNFQFVRKVTHVKVTLGAREVHRAHAVVRTITGRGRRRRDLR